MAQEKMKLTGNGAIGTSQRSDAHRNGNSDRAVERALDFGKMWAIMKKNWMVLKSDRIRLIPLMLFPIIMIVIFGYATGSMPKHISAAIVDYDHTEFSGQVAEGISAMETLNVKYTLGTKDEGKRLMDTGSIRVLVILPDGLEDKVSRGEPAQMQVMVDESDSSVASIAKSAVQSYAQRLSLQVTQKRLIELSVQAQSARSDMTAIRAGADQSSASLAVSSSQDAVAAYWTDTNYYYQLSKKGVGATIQGLKNSLGYLVDENEVADSFTPASVSTATLALLATGDSQQSVMQQIGSYQGIQSSQARLMADASRIYSSYLAMAGIASGQMGATKSAGTLAASADAKLQAISSRAETAISPISVETLEPYGYGRRGIDFLLPAILATIIFQGAAMGLGRAIAGERQDGSLTRVFLTPTSNVTIILGTQLFYLMLETIRSSLIILVAVMLFGVSISGNLLDIVALIAIYSFGCTGIGMVLSVITKSQEQYMAVGMLVSLPTMFLSGVFFPIQTMPPFLQGVAQYLPVTYAADALRGVMVKGFALYQVLPDLLALAVFGAVTLSLSLMLFKRELV